jgi:transcriptional regulator with XRE-family HTH domain
MSNEIGKRLKELRIRHGYSQEEIGEALGGINKQTVFKYETGVIVNIPYSKMETLADLYKTTPIHILGWDKKYLSVDEQLAAMFNQMNDNDKIDVLKYCNLLIGQHK